MSDKLVLVDDLTATQIASICDHSILETYTSFLGRGEDPRRLREHSLIDFLDTTIQSERAPYAICVLPECVPTLVEFLDEHDRNEIKVASAIYFPYGSVATELKVSETRAVTAYGAAEIDVVLNYEAFTSGDIDTARDDAKAVADAAHENGALAKLIIETCLLAHDQLKAACDLADEAGADFVKTSTGAWSYGATIADMILIREYFSGGVKISGAGVGPRNIRDLLRASAGRVDGYIDLNPARIRIGEGGLIHSL
ncbi:MAG: deoxyribose-phosphate aldolase [Candidatus Poribacteria bacterium]|nr:deoxyribose-phosphate aldolase [Candidatus Poribacteria bacterium]MDE0505847.1 deoxyribose-phosphate aldolase [Candidatus Poribacteria bacterium]